MVTRRRAPSLTVQRLLALRRARILDRPAPCFMKLKLVRGGPWVPALIWRPCPMIEPIPFETTPSPEEWCCRTERPRPLCATIGDDAADPFTVWERGTMIGAVEYLWRMRVRDWAMTYAPHQPEANPKRPVDVGKLPSLF